MITSADSPARGDALRGGCLSLFCRRCRNIDRDSQSSRLTLLLLRLWLLVLVLLVLRVLILLLLLLWGRRRPHKVASDCRQPPPGS